MCSGDARLDAFLSSSEFNEPVYRKKLRFIFSTINSYASLKRKRLEDINILEIACGRGGITFPLASLDCKVKVFDIDDSCVEYVQNRIDHDKIPNLTVTVDDGYTFVDGETYDIVVASEVFEHVLEPKRLAENITRSMAKGSHLIVTTPNGYGPWELMNRVNPLYYLRKWNWLLHLLGKSPYVKGSSWGHVQFYSRHRLMKLFSIFHYKLINFAKSDSLLSMFSPKRSALLGNIDIMLADILPYWLANGWYFLFELEKGNNA